MLQYLVYVYTNIFHNNKEEVDAISYLIKKHNAIGEKKTKRKKVGGDVTIRAIRGREKGEREKSYHYGSYGGSKDDGRGWLWLWWYVVVVGQSNNV